MRFLVWSNQHRMWWRANHRGYTEFIDEAGRYDRAAAERIVADATLDGLLTVRRTDPVTNEDYSQLSEVLVLAPEDIPAAGVDPTTAPNLERPSFELIMRAQETLGEARDVETKAGRNGAAMVLNDLVISLFQMAINTEFDALADTAYRSRHPGQVSP